MSTRHPAKTWRKSSHSGTNADCVECSSATWHAPAYSGSTSDSAAYAQLPPSVAVRDSKRPNADRLSFPGPEWSAFLTAVKGASL
ncbi:hypothetical protein F4561_000315 [Lipingzhangella halophila]|uniref:DUF397 domain-containing protein n=1 Tax=Lipingzhangella halophila TaxID=1783352 RepID=A0A7W7RCT7_9ACTN|nr:DUF397 domain-containing protein [Lipingzhangella halophila]MBB4929495.1 hypothetical protein [Lipingzhangella halophila]